MATIDTYKIKISVDGKDQVNQLNDSLDTLKTSVAAASAAGVAAFTALAASAIRMADAMVDVSDSIGISVSKIYQLNLALEDAGGSFGDAQSLFKGFSNTLGDVEKGSQETIDALTKLGLSRRELEFLSDEQLFQAVVNGLGKMEAGFERNRMGMQLLGKAADGIDWAKMAAGTNKAVDPAMETNLRLAADAVGSIEKAFRSFQQAALEAIAPVLQVIGNIQISVEDARKAIQIFGALIAGAFGAYAVTQVVKMVEAVKALVTVIRAAGAAQAFFVGLSGVGLAAVAASAAAATAAYIALGKAMEDAGAAPATPGAPTPPPVPTPGTQRQRVVGQTAEDKALNAAKATTAELKAQNEAALKYQQTINGTIGMSQEQASIAKINAQLEKDIANNTISYEKQKQAERDKGNKANLKVIEQLDIQKNLQEAQLKASAELSIQALNREQALKQTTVELQKQLSIIDQQNKQNIAAAEAETMRRVIAGEISQQEANNINNVNKVREDGLAKVRALEEQLRVETDNLRKQELQNQITATKQATDFAISEKQREIAEKIKLEQSAAAGIKSALEQVGAMYTPFKVAADQTTLLFDRMGQGLDEFVKTGKLNFKNFALSLIRDLMLIQIKAQAMNWLKGMMGGGGGLFGGILIPGLLAEGGPAKAGKPYIVGEKGPELFVPKTAGTVIPNNAMQTGKTGMAAGAISAPVTNNYITNNVSAIDAQSVAQFFAQNRRLMLGSVEMARKELPYGTSR